MLTVAPRFWGKWTEAKRKPGPDGSDPGFQGWRRLFPVGRIVGSPRVLPSVRGAAWKPRAVASTPPWSLAENPSF